MIRVTLKVNRKPVSIEVEPRTLLVELLRDKLQLTGTHVGCDTSHCGACVVHVGGLAIKACTMLPMRAEGAEVTTIEGLSPDGSHPVQQAWVATDAPQCGFCQAGQIMAAAALLAANPRPTPDQVDVGMSANVCRCGSYTRIRAAIQQAAGMALAAEGGER